MNEIASTRLRMIPLNQNDLRLCCTDRAEFELSKGLNPSAFSDDSLVMDEIIFILFINRTKILF